MHQVLDPQKLDAKSVYKILAGTVVPRPIALTSTVSAAGIRNLAPFSFFNVLSHHPPLLTLSIGTREPNGEDKDTVNNLKDVGEFVVNIVNDKIVQAQSTCATHFPPGVDEFDVSGLTPVPSLLVRPPRVKESPVNFECRVLQILKLPESPSSLVIGQICLFHLREDVIDKDGRIITTQLRPVGRLAGDEYCHTQGTFTLDYDAFDDIRQQP
ncbi:MAG: flavin reductase family protein [Pseudorhodoplanes sp.]|uniref:flavin reductase family protein n=1 Tax=Pseudorhodoplanes sp. TaxID=1934341 RepID=UPI003D10EA05